MHYFVELRLLESRMSMVEPLRIVLVVERVLVHVRNVYEAIVRKSQLVCLILLDRGNLSLYGLLNSFLHGLLLLYHRLCLPRGS